MTVWHLRHARPAIEVRLRLANGQRMSRWLVADTGAGTARDAFELILDEDDCLQCGGIVFHQVALRGAFVGTFPVYQLDVEIPSLQFDDPVNVVGVPQVPPGFDGFACFRFLHRFNYGNFGDPDVFGIENLNPS